MDNIGNSSEFNQGTQQATEAATETAGAVVATVAASVEALQDLLLILAERFEQPPDTVSVRVGSKTVYKGPLDGSGAANLNEKQQKAISDLVQDPSSVQGSVRIFGDDPKTPVYHNTAGMVKQDSLQLFEAPQQVESVQENVAESPPDWLFKKSDQVDSVQEGVAESPTVKYPPPDVTDLPELQVSSESVEPVPTTVNEQLAQTLAPTGEIPELLQQVQALQERVANLESQLNQPSIVEGAKDKIGQWFNGVRNRAAASVHSLADRIEARAQQDIGLIQTKVEDIVQGVQERAAQDKQLIRDGLVSVAQGVQDRAQQDTQLIKDRVENAVQGVQDRVDSVIRPISDAAQGFKSETERTLHQFLAGTVEPNIRDLILYLEPAEGVVQQLPEGVKQFSSQDYDYQLAADGQVTIIPHDQRASLNYDNVQARDVQILSVLATRVKERIKPQQLNQTQTPSQQIKVPALKQ